MGILYLDAGLFLFHKKIKITGVQPICATPAPGAISKAMSTFVPWAAPSSL
jgi:hypothetical protein